MVSTESQKSIAAIIVGRSRISSSLSSHYGLRCPNVRKPTKYYNHDPFDCSVDIMQNRIFNISRLINKHDFTLPAGIAKLYTAPYRPTDTDPGPFTVFYVINIYAPIAVVSRLLRI